MKKSPGIETTSTRNASVLSVSPNDEDCVSLERIFHESDWTVYTNSTWTPDRKHYTRFVIFRFAGATSSNRTLRM